MKKKCRHKRISIGSGRNACANYYWCYKCGALGYQSYPSKLKWFYPGQLKKDEIYEIEFLF